MRIDNQCCDYWERNSNQKILTGSREFVEEYKKKLIDRGVVYINTDTAVSGPIMFAEASPTITQNVIKAAKRVPYINNDYDSYYDFWKEWLELKVCWIKSSSSNNIWNLPSDV